MKERNMWEEDKEYEIFDDLEEDYYPEYDSTDCFSCLDMSSIGEEGFEEDEDDYFEDKD